MSISDDVRYKGDVTREDINHPDVAEWNWRYHMHISLEDLMSTPFCDQLKKEIAQSGRITK